MGSGQSQPTGSKPISGDRAPTKNFDDAAVAKTNTGVTDPKEASLSGMPLVHYKCRKRKKVYDRCVSKWYSEQFLPGKSVDQEEACGELFENYRTCILKGIRKEIWEKQGLPPPKEGSPLDEVGNDDE